MRYLFIALSLLLCPIAFAQDDLNIKVETRGDDIESFDDDSGSSDDNVGSPDVDAEYTGDDTEYSDAEADASGVDLDIDVPEYPEMVPVPNYPVYYAPRVNSNYFFYDGLYWVYWEDNWYMSSWYRGPWRTVTPEVVPLFVLRVPVRYYRRPPAYFRSWREDAPPRWGEHWGRSWEERRHGWDRWDHGRVHHIAPLPVYQRLYSGDRYPREARQRHSIRSEHYRYQPREAVSQRHYIQRPNVNSLHAEPHEQALMRQRSSTFHEEGRPNPRTPRVRPTHQPHTMQLSPQLQHSPTTPHNNVRENKKEEHRRDHR
jgi:hypothetical protein